MDWPEADLEPAPACPVCASTDRTPWRVDVADEVFRCAAGRWSYARCGACGAAWLDPRPTRGSVMRAYARYYTHRPEPGGAGRSRGFRRALHADHLRVRWGYSDAPRLPLGRFLLSARRRAALDISVRHLPRPEGGGRLLDVGCGNGAFLESMRARGWDVCGVEPDPVAAEAASKAGVAVVAGTIADAPWGEGSFDAVTLSSVIEHVHDPAALLASCFRLLRPGGRLHVVTPNVASAGALRFGVHWRGLEAPRHLVLFDRGALARLLSAAGFAEVTFHPHFMGEWFFTISGAMERGIAPDEVEHLATAEREALRRDGRAADALTMRRPENAEELVVTARKPVEAA